MPPDILIRFLCGDGNAAKVRNRVVNVRKHFFNTPEKSEASAREFESHGEIGGAAAPCQGGHMAESWIIEKCPAAEAAVIKKLLLLHNTADAAKKAAAVEVSDFLAWQRETRRRKTANAKKKAPSNA